MEPGRRDLLGAGLLAVVLIGMVTPIVLAGAGSIPA